MEKHSDQSPQRELITAETAGISSFVISLTSILILVLGSLLVPRLDFADHSYYDYAQSIVLLVAFTGFMVTLFLSFYAYLIASKSENPRRARLGATAGLLSWIGFFLFIMCFGVILVASGHY